MEDIDSLYIVDETFAMFKHIIDFIRNCETNNISLDCKNVSFSGYCEMCIFGSIRYLF